MKRIVRRRPSPAMVVSLAAFFVALGGTGYAAVALAPKNSVGSAQVINGSLLKKDLNKKTVAALKGNRGPAGAAGAAGAVGATGPAGAAGAAGAVGATGPTGAPGSPSTAGRIAVTNVNTGPSTAGGVVDLGTVTITAPSDAHFVHVVANATLYGTTAQNDYTFWLIEGACSVSTIVDATRGFDSADAAGDQLVVSTEGVFAATAAAHTYHFCLLSTGTSSSGWIHIVASTEALNGTGGTSAPVTAPSKSVSGDITALTRAG